MMSSSLRARRPRERNNRGDGGDRHNAGEGPEKDGATEGDDQVRSRTKEDDREDAERHADGSEESMRMPAMRDRAVGEAQRAAHGGAGDHVAERHRCKGRRQRRDEERNRRQREANSGHEPRVDLVESWSADKAGCDGADEEQRREAPGLRRREPILRDERADPDRQGDQIDHARAVRDHQRDATAPALRACLHCRLLPGSPFCSDRRGERLQRVAHDLRGSAGSPPAISISATRPEFSTTMRQRSQRRSSNAARAAGDRRCLVQLLGQHDGVLDADAGAGGEMRGRRVHGVADQHDAPFRPRTWQEEQFERTVDDHANRFRAAP